MIFDGVPGLAVPGALVPGRPYAGGTVPSLHGAAVTITAAAPLLASARITAAGPLVVSVAISQP